MKTQQQVWQEILQAHTDDLHTRDVNGIFRDRIDKAGAIVEAGAVTRNARGEYLIRGTQPEPYIVNGTCQCEDYTRENAPRGWCKHKIAAKLYQLVSADIDALQAQGIVHEHATCSHVEPIEPCWEIDCTDALDQRCEQCAPSKDYRHPVEHITEQYEPNPNKKVKRPTRPGTSHVTMPEAPASLNLKLKGPYNTEIMYTARSMKTGRTGDEELRQRLDGILETIEALVDQQREPAGWFRKLITFFNGNGKG